MQTDTSKPGGCLDRAALAVLGVLLVLSIVGAVTGSRDAARVFGSAMTAGVAFLAARTALKLGPGPALRTLGVMGAAAAAGSFLCVMLLIWEAVPLTGTGPDPVAVRVARAAAALGSLALLAADAGAQLQVRLRRVVDRGSRAVALFTASLIVLMIVLMCASGDPSPLQMLAAPGAWVPATIFGATAVCTHLATPILGRLEVRREAERLATAPDRALLTLQCPRCSIWMQMHSGLVSCPGCRLPLRVEFDEPRCACGYPLHRLQGECCPECGRHIPVEQRWGRGTAPSVTPGPAAAPQSSVPQAPAPRSSEPQAAPAPAPPTA